LRHVGTSVTLAAVLAVSLAVPAVAKPVCYTAQDIKAAQVRQAQVELMVGALKCQDPELGFRSKYSEFVNRFNSAIAKNGSELRALFNRLGKGERGLDRFMTELSNDASIRSAHVDDYCGAVGTRFDQVLSLKPHELVNWASERVDSPLSGAACAKEKQSPIQEAKVPGNAKAKPSKAVAKKDQGKS